MADKPKTVTVEALEAHTAFGKSYDIGDTYDVSEDFVYTLETQGKAKRYEPGQKSRTRPAKTSKAAKKK